MFDIIIIGTGITGTTIARLLSQYQLKVGIFDKENDIADGATMANSAIVHTGYDPEDNTMKAKMNVRGAQLYKQLCADLGCKYKVVGAYVVATSKEEEEKQEVLADRAQRRNIPYEWLTREEANEPNLNESVIRILSFPTTAVIYPWEVAIACCQVAVRNGVELHLNEEIQKINRNEDGYVVQTSKGQYETKIVINCAGVGAEKIYRMVSENVNFMIHPRKGEYFVIDNSIHYVNHIIFPIPSLKGKGVLAVPTVYGNTLLGPNSDQTDEFDNYSCTNDGLNYVRDNITKTMKNIPFQHTIRNFAGLRPSSSSKDFIIEEAKDAKNFINVASIESPGLASAPAIAEYVVNELLKDKFERIIKENVTLTRNRPLVMSELSEKEKQEVIQKNPLYGRMICRCEQISEGEIVDCIHEICGATTVKGVKKRVRPGMGRCQGGFCEPRVVKILARELNCSPLDIVLDQKESKILESRNR